jgi:hypothetical protein
MTDPKPRRGCRHLWVPRRPATEATGRLLLVALAADRPEGHPDNVAATARLLRASEPSVRTWRSSALADGLLERTSDGRLVPGPAWQQWERDADAALREAGGRGGWDPLPRAFLRRGRRPAIIHAAAVVYSDAVGWRKATAYVRADAERAGLAGTCRASVRAARREMEAAGLITVQRLKRGRAALCAAQQADGRPATHGSPMAGSRAQTLAERAARHRAAMSGFRPRNEAPATPKWTTPATPKWTTSHHQVPSEPIPIRAPNARFDGQSRLRQDDGRQAVEQWLATPSRCEQWLIDSRSRPQQAAGELLALTKCWDRAPRRRERLAAELASRYRRDVGTLLLAVLCDLLVTNGRHRPRSIGAVLAMRVAHMTAGKASDGIGARHRTSTVAQLLADARARARVTATA